MVFFCLSEDCFDCSNHSMDGHPFTSMEAHSREYQSRNSVPHAKGPAPIPSSVSQSAINSQLLREDHQQRQFSSSQEFDNNYNERYLDKYNVSNDSCKQMGLQIGLQPKTAASNQFSAISEHDSELSVGPSPMPPRPLQRHYSVVDPKSFVTDIGKNVPAGK